MTYHKGGHSCTDKLLEGVELGTLQAFARERDSREGLMRILFGIPMTREVLATSQYPYALHALGESYAFLGNIELAFAKRAVTYDRIFWIGIDVNIRCKINMHS